VEIFLARLFKLSLNKKILSLLRIIKLSLNKKMLFPMYDLLKKTLSLWDIIRKSLNKKILKPCGFNKVYQKSQIPIGLNVEVISLWGLTIQFIRESLMNPEQAVCRLSRLLLINW
jgi:hypothetical protein